MNTPNNSGDIHPVFVGVSANQQTQSDIYAQSSHLTAAQTQDLLGLAIVLGVVGFWLIGLLTLRGCVSWFVRLFGRRAVIAKRVVQ